MLPCIIPVCPFGGNALIEWKVDRGELKVESFLIVSNMHYGVTKLFK
jgi:hypothetical protein